MKSKLSLLNSLFLLLFWWFSLPLLIKYLIRKEFSLHDDYCVQALIILIVSLVTFVLLAGLHSKYEFWCKLNCWMRYIVFMAVYIVNWVVIIFLSLRSKGTFNIPPSCSGGSPLLMFSLSYFYAIAGLLWTVIASILGKIRSLKEEAETKKII